MNLDVFYSCSSEHLVFIAKDNTVHTLGCNSDCFSLGVKPEAERPDNVISLPVEVVQVATGDHHTLALLKDGTVCTWGDNKYDELGIEREIAATTPTLVPLSTREKIISVHAGSNFSLLRNAQDQVFVFGQLQKYASVLEFPLPIQSISCGASHVLVLTKNGTVYGFGDNSDGQLCSPELFFPAPTLLPVQDITTVAAGSSFSFFLTSQGSLLTTGYNSYAALGLQTTLHSRETKVALEKGVVGVAAGGFHVFALMEDGGVLGWGWNGF
jgi:alpha-tubulin suppressor-like RCC1 family protein